MEAGFAEERNTEFYRNSSIRGIACSAADESLKFSLNYGGTLRRIG